MCYTCTREFPPPTYFGYFAQHKRVDMYFPKQLLRMCVETSNSAMDIQLLKY